MFAMTTSNVMWVATKKKKKNHVLDRPIVPNMWLVKIGTNLTRGEVLALEDVGFQLQQGEAFPPCCKLSTIAILPILELQFCMPPNPYAHSTSRLSKTMCCNLTTVMADYKNKWENIGLMDDYYVVGITAISYPTFGVIINIASKNWHLFLCHGWWHPTLHMPGLHENVLSCLEDIWKWVYFKHSYYVFRFMCKVDYDNGKAIHAWTYNYNEVMMNKLRIIIISIGNWLTFCKLLPPRKLVEIEV